jgi:hypothetical protein
LVFEATLHHGEWKRQNNHVIRPDGSVLEYTPGLLRHDLAPLVVDRRERDRYLQSLNQANLGDLRPLVSFFAELEIVALRSELEQPVAIDLPGGRGALAVLDAGIDRLRELKNAAGAQERGERVAALASSIYAKIGVWLQQMATTLESRYGMESTGGRARALPAKNRPTSGRATGGARSSRRQTASTFSPTSSPACGGHGCIWRCSARRSDTSSSCKRSGPGRPAC